MKWNWLALAILCAACSGDGTPRIAVGAAEFRVLSPSDGGAANAAQPVISWTTLAGAVTYECSVYGDAALTDLLDRVVVAGDAVRLAAVLADGREIHVEVVAFDADGVVLARRSSRFKVVLLPAGFPGIELRANDPARAQGGYKLFNLIDREPDDGTVAPLVLVNAAGEVVWLLTLPDGRFGDARVLDNGNLLVVFRRTGGAVAREMTWAGDVLWQSRDGVNAHHECSLGPGGNYVYVTTIFSEQDGINYEGDGLELVDPATNDVLWSWDIFDHFDPAVIVLPEELGVDPVDWSHSNAVVWDEARGVFWMSIRNFDRIVGIDYPSGDVRITLGEGGLGGEGAMAHQHAPEVQADGQILFWDNGNLRFPQQSRAVIVDFDETTGRYEETFQWMDDPPFYDRALGDADRQPNGNVLITAGVSRRLIEVTMTGEIVWEIRIGDNTDYAVYRAEQVPAERIPRGVLPFD